MCGISEQCCCTGSLMTKEEQIERLENLKELLKTRLNIIDKKIEKIKSEK